MPYREWSEFDPVTREPIRCIAERPPDVIPLDPKPRSYVRYSLIPPRITPLTMLATIEDVSPLVEIERKVEYAHKAYMCEFITTSEGRNEDGLWRRGFERIVTCWGWFPASERPVHIPDDMQIRLKAALAGYRRADSDVESYGASRNAAVAS